MVKNHMYQYFTFKKKKEKILRDSPPLNYRHRPQPKKLVELV
jgi:hypothetical protein